MIFCGRMKQSIALLVLFCFFCVFTDGDSLKKRARGLLMTNHYIKRIVIFDLGVLSTAHSGSFSGEL